MVTTLVCHSSSTHIFIFLLNRRAHKNKHQQMASRHGTEAKSLVQSYHGPFQLYCKQRVNYFIHTIATFKVPDVVPQLWPGKGCTNSGQVLSAQAGRKHWLMGFLGFFAGLPGIVIKNYSPWLKPVYNDEVLSNSGRQTLQTPPSPWAAVHVCQKGGMSCYWTSTGLARREQRSDAYYSCGSPQG